ncbi:hypothetical protein SAMN04487907_11110 [Zunongwangia mangrovi]|uniref:Uncharacterized protein n=1 Tax=Zunongwangia mangrovi TaxID=1334022 RepID=A0A1I1N1Z3_9FLAO|nr:hypothetical protein [Zunongwangia mangrovi]SFC87820.1 hypothetical protein SAMN04487907_11110 [Zunongwangia mangrovi]
MNFELADKLSELLESKKLDEAIALAEQELKKIPTTDFHKIIDKNLLHLTSDLAKYINEFDKSTKEVLRKKQGFIKNLFGSGKEVKPAAYYCEMNGFTINYDRWFIDLFSFKNYSLTDWEWLSDFYDSTANDLTITGFEDIQKAFEDIHENNRFEEPNIKQAYEVCELLVILRLQELFRETYMNEESEWSKIPMFVTAHDYEMIYKVN